MSSCVNAYVRVRMNMNMSVYYCTQMLECTLKRKPLVVVHVYTRIAVCMCKYVHLYPCTCILVLPVHLSTCTFLHVYMYSCVIVHLCLFVNVYMCTCVRVGLYACITTHLCTCRCLTCPPVSGSSPSRRGPDRSVLGREVQLDHARLLRQQRYTFRGACPCRSVSRQHINSNMASVVSAMLSERYRNVAVTLPERFHHTNCTFDLRSTKVHRIRICVYVDSVV